jgi:hypothetical protein
VVVPEDRVVEVLTDAQSTMPARAASRGWGLLRILVWQLGPPLYVTGGLFLAGAGRCALVDPGQPVFAEA